MYSDQEAYEMMRQLVRDGKYKKAYQFCISHKCQDQKMKASLECAKDILNFINSESNYKRHFNWMITPYRDPLYHVDNMLYRMRMRFVGQQISELKSMFHVN